jgi:sugar transferase (PEP-CTERM system associated)
MIRIFSHWFHWRPLLQALLDSSFIIVGVFILLMWSRNGLQIDPKQFILFSSIVAAVAMFINTLIGLYQRIHGHNVITGRAYLFLSLYLSFPIAYTIYVLLPLAPASRELAQLSVMSAAFGLLVTRIKSLDPVTSKVAKRRILVFGTGIKAHEVKRALTRSDPSAEIVGFFAGPNEIDTIIPGMQIVCPGGTLLEAAITAKVQEIVVAITERRGGSMPLHDLLDCKLRGIKVLDLASYFERTLGQIRLDSLYAGWLIFGEGFDQGRSRVVIKRLSDIVFSLILLVMALPVMLITALLIGLESGFPILYRQERVGLNGRLFNVIKFRSMCNDAEKGGMPRWATANDDRVTRVGHFIRKFRIDELPQLFSVLTGHMSLIGPRPERPFFVDQLGREIPFYAVRHSVKPGVTGWAQVRYHYGATVEDAAEKLQYDLYYVKNHSLLLDLVILFETVGVVIGRKGAH